MEVKELLNLPFLLEQDEDWIWVANCPYFDWMYTQWYDLKELEYNIQDLSGLYFDMIKDWEKPYKAPYVVNVNFNKDGQITNNISKEIEKDLKKKMIWVD